MRRDPVLCKAANRSPKFEVGRSNATFAAQKSRIGRDRFAVIRAKIRYIPPPGTRRHRSPFTANYSRSQLHVLSSQFSFLGFHKRDHSLVTSTRQRPPLSVGTRNAQESMMHTSATCETARGNAACSRLDFVGKSSHRGGGKRNPFYSSRRFPASRKWRITSRERSYASTPQRIIPRIRRKYRKKERKKEKRASSVKRRKKSAKRRAISTMIGSIGSRLAYSLGTRYHAAET